MIPAHKFPLGRRLVWQLIERSFRKYFDRVYFRMRGTYTDEQRATLPMLICANHSSWWDGYVIALVERLLNVDGYLMVEEAQLSRYFFFTWIGCFSVDHHNPRAALQSLKYAATLLKGNLDAWSASSHKAKFLPMIAVRSSSITVLPT